jgi:hypothetical protein
LLETLFNKFNRDSLQELHRFAESNNVHFTRVTCQKRLYVGKV